MGRALLRSSAFHLRLQREGEQFTALARRAPGTDGLRWLTCGQVEFPAREPLLIGIASLRGVVARFDWVRVLVKPQGGGGLNAPGCCWPHLRRGSRAGIMALADRDRQEP